MRDVAVLSVPRLTARAAQLATGTVGEVGAVYGHPGGGPLAATPARIGDEILAVGTDIYRTGDEPPARVRARGRARARRLRRRARERARAR